MYRQAAAVYRLGLERATLVKDIGDVCRRREAALPVQYRQFHEGWKGKSNTEVGEFMAEQVKKKSPKGSFAKKQAINLVEYHRKGGWRLPNVLRKSLRGKWGVCRQCAPNYDSCPRHADALTTLMPAFPPR